MEPIIVYTYKVYSLEGDFYHYKTADKEVRVEGTNHTDFVMYSRFLIELSLEHKREINPVNEVPPDEKNLIRARQGFQLFTPLDPQDIAKLSKELRKALSGK